jgi:Tir chaperone protein (CesT) family
METGTLRSLISDAGPLDDLILEIAELAEDGAGWVVRFEHVDVRVENLEKHHKIGFSAVIAGPDAASAPAAFRALLAANVLWRQNGGLRFALGSSDNLVELSIELADAGVTTRDIAAYCRGLAEHAATWSLIFQGLVSVGDDPGIPADFNAEFIRL